MASTTAQVESDSSAVSSPADAAASPRTRGPRSPAAYPIVVIAATVSSGCGVDPAALTAAGNTTLIPSPHVTAPARTRALVDASTVVTTPEPANSAPPPTMTVGPI